jgi:hypothetical protein
LINPAILPFRHIQAALGLGKHKHYLSLAAVVMPLNEISPLAAIKLRQLYYLYRH